MNIEPSNKTFFEKLIEIERQNDVIIENIGLAIITEDEGKFQSKKLYKDFILSFHYPHEHGYKYEVNEFKNNNTQPFNGQEK